MPAPARAGTASSRRSGLRGRLELGEFVDDGLSARGVAPDADALICRGLPGVLVDDDRVPADFPFETRRGHGVVREFSVVGVLTDGQRHLEAEFLHALIRRGHVVEVGNLNVQVLYPGADWVDR